MDSPQSWELFATIRQSGRARFVGVSASPRKCAAALQAGADAVEVRLSRAHPEAATTTLGTAASTGALVFTRSAFDNGTALEPLATLDHEGPRAAHRRHARVPARLRGRLERGRRHSVACGAGRGPRRVAAPRALARAVREAFAGRVGAAVSRETYVLAARSPTLRSPGARGREWRGPRGFTIVRSPQLARVGNHQGAV